jgi:malate dehydrogenase (oxaloacetate-decarboxylating)(NADP+)
MHMVLRPKEVHFLADCAVNISPDAEALAEIALLTAHRVRSIGIEPRVALLSFSNFGGSDHPAARKVREAAAIARERSPDINLDGEIQVSAALDEEFRGRHFPFCELEQNANVLIFPDLQSGNLALNLLRKLSASVSVGPILMGTRRPVHLLPPGATAEQVVNLVALGVVLAGDEG